MAEDGSNNLNTKATVAGGGAGTLLLVLAERIPDTWPLLKAVAMYSAPAAAVALTAIWVIAAGALGRLRRRHDIDSAMKRAVEIRDRVCSDPDASTEHKAEVRRTVEEFEKLTVELIRAEFTAAADIKA